MDQLLQIVTTGFLWAPRAARRPKGPPNQLLGQSARQDIVRAIERAPGISMSELVRRIGLPWSTMHYHLHLLNQAGIISSIRLGRERRLFGEEATQGTRSAIALLRRRRIWDFVSTVFHKPGLRQTDIARGTSLQRKSLRRYIDLLKNEGLLIEVRESKYRRYYPTNRLTFLIQELGDTEDDLPPPVPPLADEERGQRP